jgi:hypothetical protein
MAGRSRAQQNAQADPGSWARTELESVEFGDERLNKRAFKILGSFSARPQDSIPQAMQTWGETKGAYRFIDNRKVTPEKLLDPHREASQSRIAQEARVLCVQDTTDLNYTHHPGKDGMGTIGSSENLQGMHVHTTKAFTPEGVPLGIIDQQSWIRPQEDFGKRKSRRDRTIDEKESYKWVHSLKATEAVQKQHPDAVFINVGDREADIYDLFLLASQFEAELLVRASWNRCVDHEEKYLWDHMQAAPVAATVRMSVPIKNTKKSRLARVHLRFAPVTVRPPKSRAKEKLDPIQLYAVYLHEPNPPKGVQPLSWMLLTTLVVVDSQEAMEVLDFYCVRWSIEVFHRILKSGCRIEKRQLQTVDRIRTCLALLSLIAWRIQQLTMLGRHVPNLPCDVIFDDHEWKALYCFIHETTQPPKSLPCLGDAMMWVARLGGFLARKSDGHPGPTVLWRGLRELTSISRAWLAFGLGRRT